MNKRVSSSGNNPERLPRRDADRLHPQESHAGERQLPQGVQREDHLYLPERELHLPDGTIIAIEVKEFTRFVGNLGEHLMQLVRGQGYLQLKAEHGWQEARTLSAGCRSPYDQIWYFASPSVRSCLRRIRARLVQQGHLSEQEAVRIRVRWYPLANTPEERVQEEQEERVSLESMGNS
jgi:hypothetical protein